MYDSEAINLESENSELKRENEELKDRWERLKIALVRLERQRAGLEKAPDVSPDTLEKMGPILEADAQLDRMAARRLRDFIPQEVLDELVEVLKFGDIKHPGEEWKTKDEYHHIAHAFCHVLTHPCPSETVKLIKDPESGQRHLAHAAVRILMAMAVSRQQ